MTLTSTSRHPEGADYFTTFRWDLDNDGAFDDATGKSVSLTLPAAGRGGRRPRGLASPAATRPSIYYAFDVGADPNAPPPATTPTTPPVATPPPGARPAPLATILAASRPKVRKRPLPIRVRFAATAPRGTAVIEVYRGKRRIGIARTTVRRGGTKRVTRQADAAGPAAAAARARASA